jgi:hypothetical protein
MKLFAVSLAQEHRELVVTIINSNNQNRKNHEEDQCTYDDDGVAGHGVGTDARRKYKR